MATGELAELLMQGSQGLAALPDHQAFLDADEVDVFSTALVTVGARLEEEGVGGDVLHFLREDARTLKRLVARGETAEVKRQVQGIAIFLSKIPKEKLAKAIATARAHASLFGDRRAVMGQVADVLDRRNEDIGFVSVDGNSVLIRFFEDLPEYIERAVAKRSEAFARGGDRGESKVHVKFKNGIEIEIDVAPEGKLLTSFVVDISLRETDWKYSLRSKATFDLLFGAAFDIFKTFLEKRHGLKVELVPGDEPSSVVLRGLDKEEKEIVSVTASYPSNNIRNKLRVSLPDAQKGSWDYWLKFFLQAHKAVFTFQP